jgi:hypothetical protein
VFNWVESHQDERYGVVVDFWGQLNKVCNSLVEFYWNQTIHANSQLNQCFGNEGWSVSIEGEKLAKMHICGISAIISLEKATRLLDAISTQLPHIYSQKSTGQHVGRQLPEFHLARADGW